LILAGLSGVLGYLVNEQRGRIDALEADLRQAQAGEERARRAESMAVRSQLEMQRMRENLALVTGPGVTYMPMTPPTGGSALGPEAKGGLFVAADHQHWHLAVHRLAPAELGREYQLWFVTEEGRVVSGGTFNSRFGQTASLSSETMPEGTMGARVTLEPVGGSISPTGPEVLKADGEILLS
jgi:hypothetical protein